MNPQQLTGMYEEASALAEAGRYEPALSKMFDYLRHCPQDGRALNDAATILFCLGRGRDAIACYEKAARVCEGDQLAQVYWNLCEAYLHEDQPAGAIGLFDDMEAMGLLSSDLLNRTADTLLRLELLGPAVELLLRSLRLNPDQEILLPMLDVIRSHRPRTAVIIRRESSLFQSQVDGLRERLALTVLDDSSQLPVRIPAGTEIALFFGCGRALAEASMQAAEMRRVVILDAQDILSPELKAVNWRAVHTVILCGGCSAEPFAEQAGPLPTTLRILNAEAIANPERIAFSGRKRGKRIAAVGPWDARRNPMFALMCFQKLHFLDPDTRLHLAGEFTDPATERYIRHMLETLDLDSVVFLDGPVRDLKKWLKDKHYILSTAIDGTGMEEVWLAMACGLRPVVHAFPGAAERLDGQYLFTLAEDFCERVLHGHYDAAQHRAAAEQRFAQAGLEQIVNDLIFRLEKEIPLKSRPRAASAATATPPVQPQFYQSSPTPTRSVEQIASEALAATHQLQAISADKEVQSDFSPSDPSENNEQRQNDAFKYNRIEGLSIEEMTGEVRGSVPFPGRR